MSNVCILTDSTAQFTQSNFRGRERVHVIPFSIQTDPQPVENPLFSHASLPRRLVPPSQQDFTRFYNQLSSEYDSILVITLSSLFNPALDHARAASAQHSNHAAVEVVDSQTTAVGLGMLVQLAAGVASAGASLTEIEQRLRILLPHLYMLFCLPELTHLARAGYMSHAQALAGEMMSMLPIFTIEEGQLVPLEKARTARHLLEVFQDFIGEFESPAHIALVRGHGGLRTAPLRQFVQETFPGTPFSEHTLQPHLAALLGPHSVSLVVMEKLE